MSSFDLTFRPNAGMPPPSMSISLPSGKAMRMLSPWPTSMAVISSMPRSVRGAKGCHSSRASRANTTPVAAILQAQRPSRPNLNGFRQQPYLHAELRDARRHAAVARQLAQVGQALTRRAGRPGDERRRQRAQESHRQERELKAGLEQLLRVDQDE